MTELEQKLLELGLVPGKQVNTGEIPWFALEQDEAPEVPPLRLSDNTRGD